MRSLLVLLCAFFAVSQSGNAASTGAKQVSAPTEAVEAVSAQAAEKKRLKIAIFAPFMANSQVLFNKRVGEELMRAGHDVTIYMLYMFNMNNPKIDIDPRIRLVSVNGSFGLDGDELMRSQAASAFNDVSVLDPEYRKAMSMFGLLYKSCEIIVKDKAFMADVENSKFDIAFTHVYNYCPVGIIHKAKIPTWIWLSSGALMDNIAELMGVPTPPSYCPPVMMDAGDSLSFVERIKSFIGQSVFKVVWKKLVADKENEILQAEFGPGFPDLIDLLSKAPLVMVNSNELYDFARPTLHKIVNIGGVGIKAKDAKPLKEEFATRIEKAKGVVVMSFGSVAPMYLMPEHWKDAYITSFAKFPDVQFFLRFEKPDELNAVLPPNAYAVKWLPQSDLLQHPKTLGLISHGGFNSVQDVLHAGVPIITTGLFGDQLRNAHLVERLGLGVNLRKGAISRHSVTAAIRRLVEDKSLKENARKIRSMIASKPVSSETLLVKWTEFLAEHKNLDNLVPVGAGLSTVVYHSIDVIAFLLLLVVSIIALIVISCRALLRKCGILSRSTVDERKKKQ